ncbi:MAG TPA: branched-chain amino acid ABC transporter permease [Stellaceae bacterium]
MTVATGAASPIEVFAAHHRFRPFEALPWLAAVAGFFLFPGYRPLAAQIFATILFALSADLVLGYAGIVTLGQAAFFGAGAYTAGVLAVHGWGEPLLGLGAAAVTAAAVGFLSGLVILRSTGLALLMQTLVVAAMLGEAANKASWLTGGDDGLQGMRVGPVFGRFAFDLFGSTAFCYCLVVLFLCWLALRRIAHSAFGRSLTGIRENVARMHAIGAPVLGRRLVAYTISAALAGISGALVAQTTGFVGLDSLSLERSGTVLIMLIIGGVGRLYGAFIGVPLYMIAQDRFSTVEPVYWYFWIGLLMVLLVTFAPGGLLGLFERLHRNRDRLGWGWPNFGSYRPLPGSEGSGPGARRVPLGSRLRENDE